MIVWISKKKKIPSIKIDKKTMQYKKKNISEAVSRRLKPGNLVLKVTEIMNFNDREGKICNNVLYQ